MMTTTSSPESTTTSQDDGSEESANFQKPTIAKLNTYYLDGDSCDTDIFSEMRSNILLVAGDHYNKKNSRFYKRIREARDLSNEQKLRLTKNHTRKICQVYANAIISTSPGVGFSPKDENSMHDQKTAEMHHSVWQDAVTRYDIDDKQDDWVDSFIQIGEVHCKLFFDPNLGKLKGFEPQTDPETGNPLLTEMMQLTPDESKPVFDGEFVFEEIYGFNLLRPPENKDLRKAEWLCNRKMVNRPELLRKYKGDEEKSRFILADQDETYAVFDMSRGGYRKTTKQTMIREYFFRPSMLYPQGYFYITTQQGILEEGELPGGLFPIVSATFDKVQTTPRGHSPIKTMRPYQAEINRSASKMAEHQITLGDDKILSQNGSKLSAGATLPGIRGITFTGNEPKILPGRDGSQYLNYMQTQITEMYQVLMVAEQLEDKDTASTDPYVLLFRSAKQKKKFQRYIKRFEKFMLQLVKLYLNLAKIHLPDDMVIMAVGKNEQVNIAEFRQLPDSSFEVKIEAQSEDIETKLGKQIVLNHALQYIGPQLKSDEIGKILRQMPFSNLDQSFDDLTIDYDSVVNDMLALDRGERPPINQYDDHVYCTKRLTARMRKADFKFLTPQIQQAYAQKVALHGQFAAANQLAIQRAEQGFIPTGGYSVVVDFYVKDPSDPTGLKTRRARVPYQAMEWLINQMEAQGQSQQSMQDMGQGALAGIAGQVNQMRGAQPGAAPQGMQPNGPAQGLNPNGSMPRAAV